MVLKKIVFLAAAVLVMGAADTPLESEARTLLAAGKDSQALSLIESGTKQNQPDAINFLAWLYDNGRAVKQDISKAEQLYRRASDQGVPYAQWRLGVMIDTGVARGTPENAVALFRAAADKGFTNALVSLGVMQSRGRGTPQDYASALKNYYAAARLKNVHAFNEIGVVFWTGEGVKADPIEAGAWFVIATTHNDPVAPKYLGIVLENVGDKALPRITDRANAIGREYGLIEAKSDAAVSGGR